MWIIVLIVIIVVFVMVAKSVKERNEQIFYENSRKADDILKKQGFHKDKVLTYEHLNNGKCIDFVIDAQNRLFAICDKGNFNVSILNFDSIIECNIIEDQVVIAKGGIGRAIVGGAVAGGVGAIVASNTSKQSNEITSMKIDIITKDPLNALKSIELFEGVMSIKKNTPDYDKASRFLKEVYASIASVIQ